jgi:hypothetical protein
MWVPHVGNLYNRGAGGAVRDLPFRLIARSDWGTGALYRVLIVALTMSESAHAAVGWPFGAVVGALTVYSLIRYSLVALAVLGFSNVAGWTGAVARGSVGALKPALVSARERCLGPGQRTLTRSAHSSDSPTPAAAPFVNDKTE